MPTTQELRQFMEQEREFLRRAAPAAVQDDLDATRRSQPALGATQTLNETLRATASGGGHHAGRRVVDPAAARVVFTMFDCDGTGAITPDELEVMLAALNLDITPASLAQPLHHARHAPDAAAAAPAVGAGSGSTGSAGHIEHGPIVPAALVDEDMAVVEVASLLLDSERDAKGAVQVDGFLRIARRVAATQSSDAEARRMFRAIVVDPATLDDAVEAVRSRDSNGPSACASPGSDDALRPVSPLSPSARHAQLGAPPPITEERLRSVLAAAGSRVSADEISEVMQYCGLSKPGEVTEADFVQITRFLADIGPKVA